jgi:DNA/RNA-binding domain of Phe-tRNA-synthetase-like protein
MRSTMNVFVFVLVLHPASAVLQLKGAGQSCTQQDLKRRALVQNKLASVCEDMCKEVGAYPKCSQCPAFVPPDATPGVMTWEELLTHMDNLSSWGHGELKVWRKTASALQTTTVVDEQACAAEDLKRRAEVQNKLASVCEDMCKEVGAYPKCSQCPAFVPPDATPGVMTWEELLTHMDNLSSWGHGELKAWTKTASQLQTHSDESACVAEDLKRRAQVQNKLASVCEDMCKEVGAYPKCSQCPAFVPPDATPGVMTWEELLTHMDNLSSWGHGELKAWTKTASQLQTKSDESACVAEDLERRAQLQNKLASVCEDMCKEVGAYPKCSQCPAFVPPDATPGVMTWEELLTHMDNLSSWGHGELKAWTKTAR